MARTRHALLFALGVFSLALLVSVEAQVVPYAQCWRTKNEGGSPVSLLYYGYNNLGHSNVSVPVSMNNYFSSPPETGVDPITSFLPGFHGLSQVVAIPSDISLNNSVSLSWFLNGTQATLNDTDVVHQCPMNELLGFSLVAPGATTFNTSLVIDAISASSGVPASQITIEAASTAELVVVTFAASTGSGTTQYEAVLNINNAFVNPNDNSLRGALSIAINAPVTNIVGGHVVGEIAGTAPTPTPVSPPTPVVAPVLIPIAHCWEPVGNGTSGHSYLYFGYVSSFNSTQFIAPNTVQNQFIGLPVGSTASPFPVFYNGINAFVSRVRVPDGTLVQWNLNGYGVLLDSANVNYACQVNPQGGLVSVGAWSNGTVTASQGDSLVNAVSTVSRATLANVQGSMDNVTTGGFRAQFTLTDNSPTNGESVYTAMWRTVSDFHLASSELQLLWTEAVGSAAANYSCSGTSSDTFGSPLPNTSSLHIPIAHCWTPGEQAGVKVGYFGYLSNYEHSLSFLPGVNNYISNAQGFVVPSVLYPGFNGFAVAVTLSPTSGGDVNNLAWNLAGNSAVLDTTNTSQQCKPTSSRTVSIVYTGVLLSNIDEVASAQQIQQYVIAKYGASDALVQFEATTGGFLATVTLTAGSPFAQYPMTAAFVTSCNNVNSFSVRSALSSMAGNATVQMCQSYGTAIDKFGTAGVTVDSRTFGSQFVTIFANCWNANGNGITGYFGYNSSSPFMVYAESGVSGGGNVHGDVPIVFQNKDPYAARFVSSTDNIISWTLGQTTATLSTQDTSKMCSGNSNATVTLSFARTLPQPPQLEPVLNYIAQLTGYQFDHIQGSWAFDSDSDFILSVTFVSLANAAKKSVAVAQEPIAAATYLVRQLVDNSTASAQISSVAGAHLYAATTGVYTAPPEPAPFNPPTDPVPVAAPAHKKISGALVFGIIVGVLLGVGILGGILFYFFKYHKGMCRDDVETRPLLAD